MDYWATLLGGFKAGGLWVVLLCVFCILEYSDILQFGAVRHVCTPCSQLSVGSQLFVSMVCLLLEATVRMASQRSSVARMSVLFTAHCVHIHVGGCAGMRASALHVPALCVYVYVACMRLAYCRLSVSVGVGGLLGISTRLVGPVQCGWISSAGGRRSGPLVGA